MTDEQLDKALNSLRDTYRVPPEPPIEAMWTAIDEQLSVSPSRWVLPRRGMPWALVGLAAAAALVIGIGVGRWTVSSQPSASDVAMVEGSQGGAQLVADDMSAPLHRKTTNYLGETEALLRELESDSQSGYGPKATTLLATTRLLLDSPAASDAHMHELLEDLELILAQVATLRSAGTPVRRQQALAMIRTALADRDVVPRVRTAVVTLASSED